jgi:hypothetical protein
MSLPAPATIVKRPSVSADPLKIRVSPAFSEAAATNNSAPAATVASTVVSL